MPSTAVSPPQRALLLLPPLLSWLLPWLLLSLALAGCAGAPVLPERQTAATAVHSAGAPPGPEHPGPEQPRPEQPGPEQPESDPAGGAPLLLAQVQQDAGIAAVTEICQLKGDQLAGTLTRRGTLEDVFLHLAGRSLNE